MHVTQAFFPACGGAAGMLSAGMRLSGEERRR
jgi:hypothetical protein